MDFNNLATILKKLIKGAERQWYEIVKAIGNSTLYKLTHKEVLDDKKAWRQDPYIRLMRLHDLTGLWLLILPVWWAIGFAANNFAEMLQYGVLSLLGAVLVRSAGCVINDIFDRGYDSAVFRTLNRPLASGRIKVKEAVILSAVLLITASSLLIWLPAVSIKVAILALLMIMVYPLMKRYTHYAQVFLGFTFNLGILIIWFAIDERVSIFPLVLYLAAVFWTIAYDTIYAYQDKQDDIKLGLKSLAVKFGDNPHQQVWNNYQLMLVLVGILGLMTGMNLLFFLGLALVARILYQAIESLNFNDPIACNKAFRSNVRYGVMILGCVLLGIIM